MNAFKNYPIYLLSFVFICFAVRSSASPHVDAGWQAIADNQYPEAQKQFHQAIQENKTNPRPCLALAFIKQLQAKYETSWSYYEKAIQHLSYPHPYVFAGAVTPRSQTFTYNSRQKGMMRILPDFIQNVDSSGVLRAGALGFIGRYYQQYGSMKEAESYYRQLHALDQWTIIGPFENISASGFDKVFPPEQVYDPNAVYTVKNGMPAQWIHVTKIRHDRWIDFTRHYSDDEAIFYANTFIRSDQKQTVQVRVGTSGSVKVFLNDEEILAHPDENNNDLDTYVAQTELQQGWNRLLIKCGYSEITQCNFLARITNPQGFAVQNLKFDTQPQPYTSKPDAPVTCIRNFAEQYFERLINKHPDHYENYLLLSECYLRNDKAVEAEQVLRKLEKKMPDCVLVLKQLLEAYIRGEKEDEINSTVAKIYDIYPDVPDILEQKYAEYNAKEDFKKMEDAADRYINLLPESQNAMIMQFTIAYRKGEREKAIDILRRTYKKYPNDWDTVHLMALISYQLTQEYDGAIKIYKNFLKRNHIDNAYYQLGETYLKNSQVDKFEETFQEMIERDPAAVGIYYMLANVFLQMQDYQRSLQSIQKGLEICPSCSQFWALQGENRQSQGHREESIRAYQTALKFNPKNYEARNRLRELQDKPPVFDQFKSLDIDSLIAFSPTASAYPEDGAVIILDEMKQVVYNKGASENLNEKLIKVFNAEGIDDFTEYWLPHNPYTEKLIVDKAVVYKADQTEVEADVNENQIVFKALEPNDCIYLRWRVQNYFRGRLSHHIWEEIHFNHYYPIEHISYALLTPKSFQFQHKTQNMPDDPDITKTSDGILYQWGLSKIPAIDVEYNMPLRKDIGKMLYISSIPNWKYLVDWYLDLSRTKTDGSYEVREKVHELLPDLAQRSKIEIIRAIYNYITENIHYSSTSFRQSGLVPQKARNVLVQKIGDCKDVATLCIAMLKEAGISSHFVLVNTFDEGQNRNVLPSIAFNHAIVGAETNQGILYMDLTAQNYPLFTIPKSNRDAFALKIKPGETAPFYLNSPLFMPGITQRTSTMKCGDDNTVTLERETFRRGEPGALFRDRYRFKSPADQKKELTEVLSQDFPNVKVITFAIDDIDLLGPEITYVYEFTVPHYLMDASDMKLLKLPWTDNAETRKSVSYEERTFDCIYRFDYDTLYEKLTIELPPGYIPMDIDDDTHYNCVNADYHLKIKYKNGFLYAERTYINKKDIVTTAEYPAFRKFYNQVVRQDAKQFLLKRQ